MTRERFEAEQKKTNDETSFNRRRTVPPKYQTRVFFFLKKKKHLDEMEFSRLRLSSPFQTQEPATFKHIDLTGGWQEQEVTGKTK